MPCLACRGNMFTSLAIWERQKQNLPVDDPPFIFVGFPPKGFEAPRICRVCGVVSFPPEGSRSEALPPPGEAVRR